MSAEGWVLVIGAIASGFAFVYGVWLKGRQDRQRDVVTTLQEHIIRLEREIDANNRQIRQKQDAIDELYTMHADCEIREEIQYSWMERAADHISRQDDRLTALGSPPEAKLTLPQRRKREEVDRAAYLQRRAQFNTAINEATQDAASLDKAKKSTGTGT